MRTKNLGESAIHGYERDDDMFEHFDHVIPNNE